METLNIRVEVPSTGLFDIGELEQKLTEYTKKIVLERVVSQPFDDVKDFDISPLIKKLETGFVCPDDMTYDYKRELSQLRADRYL